MPSLEKIRENLEKVRQVIAGRPVTIVAVTKYHDATIYDLCRKLGLYHIGENRAQEVRQKIQPEGKKDLVVHFIAPVQLKNVKYLRQRIDSYDALSDERLLEPLSHIREEPLPVLLQVNVTGEMQKSGLDAKNYRAILSLAKKIEQNTALRLEGIMAMGPTPTAYFKRGFADYEESTKKAFKKAQEIHKQLENDLGHKLSRLSLGMSHDYDLALEFGSTEVRLGSILWD
ncbi:MAG: alanine racemase [Leptospiraceae bacterium]|nr:alanine racemase [Leptospiraceae bacterium]MDW8305585.1 alanine racemase [Leptospiraceae bacterium]